MLLLMIPLVADIHHHRRHRCRVHLLLREGWVSLWAVRVASGSTIVVLLKLW